MSHLRSNRDSHGETVGDVPGQPLGKAIISRQSAVDIVARAALSPADRHQILARAYPVPHQSFWQVLGAMGVTEERLMDRMGASP